MNVLLIPHYQTIFGHLWHIYGYFAAIRTFNGLDVAPKQHYMAYKETFYGYIRNARVPENLPEETLPGSIKKPREKRGMKEQKYS